MIRIDSIHLDVKRMVMSTDIAVARIVEVFGAAMPPSIPGRFSWRKNLSILRCTDVPNDQNAYPSATCISNCSTW
ncbi:hypothetical protein D3C84_879130 [compost metagenome]|jgi:hypothetical protein